MTPNTKREVVAESDSYHISKSRGRYNIQRSERISEFAGRTTFTIYEFKRDGEAVYIYESGEQQASLTVEVFHPCERFGGLSPAEVSWPSTSDKRPALARALADALVLAAVEAERLDAEAGLL